MSEKRVILDWYSPKDIEQFTPEQVCWLLSHIQLLAESLYPMDPLSISEPLARSIRRPSAYFEMPILIYVELITRLEKCGLDGLILLLREALDMAEDEIAIYFNQSTDIIHKRAETALRYISGRGRKWMKRGKWEPISYHEFKNYHRKKPNPAPQS